MAAHRLGKEVWECVGIGVIKFTHIWKMWGEFWGILKTRPLHSQVRNYFGGLPRTRPPHSQVGEGAEMERFREGETGGV